jgi:hypothetical protein
MTYDPQYPPQQPAQPQGPGYGPYGQSQPTISPNYYNAYDGFGPPELRSSGAGLTSFIIGLFSGLSLLVLIVAAGVLTAKSGGRMNPQSPQAIGLGLLMIVGMIAAVIGVILAIVNLVQKDRKKLFGIFGLILNGGILLLVLVLMMIGLAVK